MLVTKFRRRAMYLTCTLSLLCVYISWTIASERAVHGKNTGHPNEAAGIAVIFFIFAYAPAYNIGCKLFCSALIFTSTDACSQITP